MKYGMTIALLLGTLALTTPLFGQTYGCAGGLGSEYFKHDVSVTGVAFSPDGKYVVSGEEKSLVFWELATGAKVRTWTPLSYASCLMAFSPDGTILGVEDRC